MWSLRPGGTDRFEVLFQKSTEHYSATGRTRWRFHFGKWLSLRFVADNVFRIRLDEQNFSGSTSSVSSLIVAYQVSAHPKLFCHNHPRICALPLQLSHKEDSSGTEFDCLKITIVIILQSLTISQITITDWWPGNTRISGGTNSSLRFGDQWNNTFAWMWAKRTVSTTKALRWVHF